MVLSLIVFCLLSNPNAFRSIAILLRSKNRALGPLRTEFLRWFCSHLFEAFLSFLLVSLFRASHIKVDLYFLVFRRLEHVHSRCCFFVHDLNFSLLFLILRYDLTDDIGYVVGLPNYLVFYNRIDFNLHFLYPLVLQNIFGVWSVGRIKV